MRKAIVIALMFGALVGEAQDIHFSQFNETPMHLNPAYTGLFDGLFRVNLNYKSQWSAMGNPYKTTAGAFDMSIGAAKNRPYLGVGAFLYKDQAGDSKFGTFQGLVSTSAMVPLNDHNKLSVGIQGGYGQRSATTNGLTWENQYVNGAHDPDLPSNETNLVSSFPYVDFSAGIAYQYRSIAGSLVGKDVFEIQAGLAGFHLNKPAQKFYSGSGTRLDPRYAAHVQIRFDIPDTRWSVRPGGYFMKQGLATETVVGSMIRFRIKNGTKVTNFFSESGVAFGCHYRVKDAIIPQLYYDLGDFFIGVSYDVNISKYVQASKYNGGFEFTLRYANLNGALYKNKR
jgi:type IX secretion system PorP/SprF family membrane protein